MQATPEIGTDSTTPKKGKVTSSQGKTALSLFSGAGGMDIGVLSARFEILACVEFDPNCCETLRLNIGKEKRKTSVIEADVRNVDPKKLMAELGLRPGELDLLFGGGGSFHSRRETGGSPPHRRIRPTPVRGPSALP